ncbi:MULTISPECIES: DUF6907 domain-containing protein [unclassified Microbispora]|uniref:DUF6907 domain-containing protein n=1 Tax=unclassified Microbispora TaxID=2614687 RepID=UPI00163BD319|nr:MULTISPECIES: hypothetical protein [unclassified Microbispora]
MQNRKGVAAGVATHSRTLDASTLTPAQRDGWACAVCGRDYIRPGETTPSVPVATLDGGQVFACVGCWPVAAGAPYWQTEPCPAWCREEHRDDDMPDEREHHSGYRAVPLREMPPVELAAGAVPPDLRASLVQGVREAGPVVELATGDCAPVRLRLAEVAELTAALGGLAALAEGGHATVEDARATLRARLLDLTPDERLFALAWLLREVPAAAARAFDEAQRGEA